MHDDFHAHLVETNSTTQESNMHGKLMMCFPDIFTVERNGTSRFTESTSIISVKDMDSTTTWRKVCCFAYLMRGVSNNTKEYESYEKLQIDFNNSLYAPIYQKFWIEILKLTSICPVYHTFP